MASTFLPPRFYLSEESIREAIQQKSMFNLIDTTEGDKIDFGVLTDEAFDKSRFKRKLEENIFGFLMKVSAPEDTILAKLNWMKLSGGSQEQFTDALRVYEVQYQILDTYYIDNWAHELQVEEIWKKLKAEAQPLS